MQVANPNRAQFTKCARTAIPYTTFIDLKISHANEKGMSAFIHVCHQLNV